MLAYAVRLFLKLSVCLRTITFRYGLRMRSATCVERW